MMGHWWMSPGSQPESPATGVSSVSVLARWHSHSLTVSVSASCTVQCTVTSSCPLSPDSDHSHALPDAWSLLRTAAMPGPGERRDRRRVSCQELVSPADPCTALYCIAVQTNVRPQILSLTCTWPAEPCPAFIWLRKEFLWWKTLEGAKC